MTDLKLAIAFFERLASKGFKLNFNYEAYGPRSADSTDPTPVVIELLSDNSTKCCNFDFHADGSFYRISGFTSGYWQDEIDGRKY